jgi:hypothetical protein
LTYAQKFFSWILKLACAFCRHGESLKLSKLLILFKFYFLLSSQAIQAKPYFSRVCGPSGRLFNKVIHSFLGLSLKDLKNNNLSLFSRKFMSYKLSEWLFVNVSSNFPQDLNANVA